MTITSEDMKEMFHNVGHTAKVKFVASLPWPLRALYRNRLTDEADKIVRYLSDLAEYRVEASVTDAQLEMITKFQRDMAEMRNVLEASIKAFTECQEAQYNVAMLTIELAAKEAFEAGMEQEKADESSYQHVITDPTTLANLWWKDNRQFYDLKVQLNEPVSS